MISADYDPGHRMKNSMTVIEIKFDVELSKIKMDFGRLYRVGFRFITKEGI